MALALVLAAVATCVVVGLIVYYAGVANYKCATSEDAMSETSTSKPKKVDQMNLKFIWISKFSIYSIYSPSMLTNILEVERKYRVLTILL